MEKDPHKLDLVSLLDHYNTEVESLNSRLLAGESWDALANQRKIVTRLASLIHKKEPHLNLLQLNMPGEEKAGKQKPGTREEHGAKGISNIEQGISNEEG
jgi:hypothetical protein